MVKNFQQSLLKDARLGLNLTQDQAAELLGVDVRTYRRYESGEVNHARSGFEIRRAGRRALIETMVREFGLESDELVREADASKPPSPTASNAEKPALFAGHRLGGARKFVGRTDELARLGAWFTDEAARGCEITGLGGCGKSSLLRQFLEVQRPPRTFVWSFYQSSDVERCLRSAHQHFTDTQNNLRTSEHLEGLLQLLAREPVVLVLDGVELLQYDGDDRLRGTLDAPELRRLLLEQVLAIDHAAGRIVLSSRLPIAELAEADQRAWLKLEVSPLDPEAQLELLQAHGLPAPDEAGRQALAKFAGHALSLAAVASLSQRYFKGDLRQGSQVQLREVAPRWPAAHRLHKLLQRHLEHLSPPGRRLLQLLTVHSGGLSPAEAWHLDQLRPGASFASLEQCTIELENLAELVLVQGDADRGYLLHPFVSELCRKQDSDSVRELHRELSRELAGALGRRPRRDYSRGQLDDIVALIEQLCAAKANARALRLYHEELGGFDRLGLQLGELALGLHVSAQLRGLVAPGHNSWLPLNYDHALFAIARGQLARAEATLVAASKADNAGQLDPSWSATLWRTRAYLQRLAGDFEGAHDSLGHSLALAHGERPHLARGWALKAAVLHDQGRPDLASAAFRQADELSPQPNFRRGLWYAEHLLETADEDPQRLDKAEALVVRNRRRCLSYRWPGHVSHCDTVLARIHLRRDLQDSARAYIESAGDWAHASAELEAKLRIAEAELEFAARGLGPENPGVNKARVLADEFGFGRFTARLTIHDH